MSALITESKREKLIARSCVTGLYWDGTAFNVDSPTNALVLGSGTTAEDFKYSWGGAVEVVEAEEELAKLRAVNPNYGRKSLAHRIHSGELDKYGAARVHVIERNRVVKLESRGANPSAYVNYLGTQISVVWSGGELAVDAL